MKVGELRRKYPRFVYERYEYSLTKKGLMLTFHFKIPPDIAFAPTIEIAGVTKKILKKLPRETLQNFAFHMGLAEIPSYWKCTASPRIVIRAGKLNAAQIRWWKNLIMKGMAEFFYKNRIAPAKHFFAIESSAPGNPVRVARKRKSRARILVPVGGGKDSLVAIELIKTLGRNYGTMVLGNVPAARALIRACKAPHPLRISRAIDPKLIALNRAGFLNGHTPFSSYLAFLGTFTAELFGYGAAAVANERSANEPTLVMNGAAINHQYSKSYDFEQSFRTYAARYLTKNVLYLSALRPLYELQIAKIASAFPRELRAAKSCNINMRKGSWCGKCAKCFNVFMLLYPFAGPAATARLFKKNLFADKNLRRLIPPLIGETREKPFDCVATQKENRAALALACGMKTQFPPFLTQFCATRNLCAEKEKRAAEHLLASWNRNNFLPRDMEKRLKSML